VKHAKPRDKAYKLSDRDRPYLLVKPSGVRYWRMNYRFGGQQRTLSVERWPEILLGDAREMLLQSRRQLANRSRSTCSQVFRYAIAAARAERDICADLRGARVTPRTKHRAAITTPAQAGGLLSPPS
jgi:integrase